jgi:MFS family permease
MLTDQVCLARGSFVYGALRVRCFDLQRHLRLQELGPLVRRHSTFPCPPLVHALTLRQVSDPKKANLYGAINTAYTVGAIIAGWFFGGPLADYAGRRAGMAAGSILVILATFMQAFAPRGQIGVFVGGRVIIGLGQGLALSSSNPPFQKSPGD